MWRGIISIKVTVWPVPKWATTSARARAHPLYDMRPPRPSARARPPARPRPQPLTSRIPLDAVGSNGTVAEQRGLRFSRIKSDVNLQEIAGALPFEDAGGCLPERWRIPQVSPPGARPVLLSWKASHWPRLSRESRFLRESWGGEIRRA